VRWTWDPRQAAANLKKHGVSFELAAVALHDPRALTASDPHSDGDRVRTLCTIGNATLFVVHTLPTEVEDGEEGRIISARKALAGERKLYHAHFEKG
jgi:uncharacterized DUF497 family protein